MGRARCWPANRELRPAGRRGAGPRRAVRATSVDLLVDDPALDALAAPGRGRDADPRLPLLVRLGATRSALMERGTEAEQDLAAALLAWATPYPTYRRSSPRSKRCDARLAELRRDDARSAWQRPTPQRRRIRCVAVIGMEGRFPSGRAIAGSMSPSVPSRRNGGWARRVDARAADTDVELRPRAPPPRSCWRLSVAASSRLTTQPPSGVTVSGSSRRLISRNSDRWTRGTARSRSHGSASRIESLGP